jgi:hypothetical protein
MRSSGQCRHWSILAVMIAMPGAGCPETSADAVLLFVPSYSKFPGLQGCHPFQLLTGQGSRRVVVNARGVSFTSHSPASAPNDPDSIHTLRCTWLMKVDVITMPSSWF